VWHLIDGCIPDKVISTIQQYGFIRPFYWQGRGSWAQFVDHPLEYLFRPHLWFILSLIMALSLLNVFLRLRLSWMLIPFSVAFFAVYASSSSVVPDRILLGILCVAIGSLYALRAAPISLRVALVTLGMAIILQILQVTFEVALWGFPYFMSTIAFGLGVFLLSLTRPRLGEGTQFPAVGRLTLGIYLCHMPLIKMLSPWLSDHLGQPFLVGMVLLPVLVFCLSAALVWIFVTLQKGYRLELMPILKRS